jgi:hypothetical protein
LKTGNIYAGEEGTDAQSMSQQAIIDRFLEGADIACFMLENDQTIEAETGNYKYKEELEELLRKYP